jgi:hypothetical protein
VRESEGIKNAPTRKVLGKHLVKYREPHIRGAEVDRPHQGQGAGARVAVIRCRACTWR